jgi:hypothetical protein
VLKEKQNQSHDKSPPRHVRLKFEHWHNIGRSVHTSPVRYVLYTATQAIMIVIPDANYSTLAGVDPSYIRHRQLMESIHLKQNDRKRGPQG